MYPTSSGSAQVVSSRRIASIIQAATSRNGENPRALNTHSLRSGGTTHMYRLGVDALTIQFHGRWASDTFKIYTRLCKESVTCITSRMVSGARTASTLQ
ncbi:hypothetical protein PHYSODRAFT_496135 [Phytophthora sojae]|uniref:Tyr recombinase domain-containing protein n=1 Tax=Phytophthora sojae (strain P6497) TaxID=1094619 RepID=G4Z5I7_PHYSP|nr:hypothetical protein PHYSODRAFT_496135 [Phytophthora sojae]EGZ21665.1 hypothetical protein PHYSODRAFT_496135 [Phytophthora sojae]|eukprot:XP_009524382.1 hypothetical protein PHYSODRAFT_496135 [Phytophthora sojae]